uniref:hypothetical protein n=1 Tax=Corynebacterium glyciniphilum TaxID=1404244 RepID=UPI0016435946
GVVVLAVDAVGVEVVGGGGGGVDRGCGGDVVGGERGRMGEMSWRERRERRKMNVVLNKGVGIGRVVGK